VSATLSPRVAALEAAWAGSPEAAEADHWREARARLGRAGDAGDEPPQTSASLGRAGGDRELATLTTRLFMERQGWTYCPGDERL
jgi:hypothetical protein